MCSRRTCPELRHFPARPRVLWGVTSCLRDPLDTQCTCSGDKTRESTTGGLRLHTLDDTVWRLCRNDTSHAQPSFSEQCAVLLLRAFLPSIRHHHEVHPLCETRVITGGNDDLHD